MNEYDSNRILDLMKEIDYKLTKNLNEANCYILNTCHIREKATDKVYHDIGRLKKNFRNKSKPIVIITGCVAQAEGDILLNKEKYIDAVIGPQSYHKINDTISKLEKKSKPINFTEFDVVEKFDSLNSLKNSDNKVSTFLTIQEGCDKFCKFCVVPYTRGAEFCNIMGKISKEKSKFPEKSFLTTAYELDIPVYISTLKDSSLALNLAVHRLKNQPFNLDFVREIIEQAAIVYNSKKSGILELGGGVPKNTAQQTGPLLDQILRKDHGGQDYIIQITDARPDTGGLSGATLQEGKSWGKVQNSHEDLITVYTDSTIAFPILALYALANEEQRETKRIYKNLGEYYETLQKSAINVPEKFAEILKKADINVD